MGAGQRSLMVALIGVLGFMGHDDPNTVFLSLEKVVKCAGNVRRQIPWILRAYNPAIMKRE